MANKQELTKHPIIYIKMLFETISQKSLDVD